MHKKSPVAGSHKKLLLIKIIHTLVWIFFNGVIFYLLYAVLADRIDTRVWAGLGLVFAEALVLLLYGMMCPLTVWARKYSGSQKDNFDIFLPNWLARYNKRIYSVIMAIILLLLIYRLITR